MIPQYIMLVFVIMSIPVSIYNHGTVTRDNFWVDTTGLIIHQMLLIWGGFYTGLFTCN